MSGTFGMTMLIDWGTDTLRWSAEDDFALECGR